MTNPPPEPGAATTDTAVEEFAEFYRSEMPKLMRFLRMSGISDYGAAEDAAQATFIELFQKWGEVRNPSAWLRTAARRYCFRLRRRTELPLDPSMPPDVWAAPARGEPYEETQVVLDALRQLPLAQRQVMALHFDQFTSSEISEILEMKDVAVRQNLARGRRSLREFLALGRLGQSSRQAA